MSTQFSNQINAQAITPNHAGEVINVIGSFDRAKIDGSAPAAGEYINLVKLPPNCIVVDATWVVETAIAGLAGHLGLNDSQNTGGSNNELIAGAAGAAVGVFRADEIGVANAKNMTDKDMWVALKVTTAPSGTTGIGRLSLSYRSILPGDV